MNELQQYYDNFCRVPSRWSHPVAKRCGCRGTGWWLSELDTFHACPEHYRGQPNNESSDEEWQLWWMLEAGWQAPVVLATGRSYDASRGAWVRSAPWLLGDVCDPDPTTEIPF